MNSGAEARKMNRRWLYVAIAAALFLTWLLSGNFWDWVARMLAAAYRNLEYAR
jgi:hypothetical protein